MASTYSQNLALELMATGDQPGEWGNTTNKNLGTLLEQAISGYAVQPVSDVGDTVITIPNGASGVARNMYIELVGTLTGNRNLVVPNNNKLYFIYNNTTGGYAVTVKTATGVGTAVPEANRVVLFCNGSDVVPAINAGGGGSGVSTFFEEVFTATSGQTVFNLTRSYVVGSNTLAVYVGGVNQIVDMSYTETDPNTVTFSNGLHEGALVKFVIGQTVSTGITSEGVTYQPAGSGAVATTVQAKLRETVSVKDFGAVGDGVTDDTAAIQAAIDYAYVGGVGIANAVYIPAGNYLCGQITTYPYTTIIGTGRHTSNLFCKPGTTGKWWSDRGNGAQKLTLSGLAFYGQNNLSLTHIAEFGDTGVQFGTEGILQDLWFRDSYSAYGLLCNANVGVFQNITVQNCLYGAKILGNGNQFTNLFAMQCEDIGADLSGCFARGIHAEATFTGGVPVKINGDTNAKDITISTATGFTHPQLIEVDTSVYTNEWSVENVVLLGSGYTISNGILKVGANYYGGTDPAQFSGTSYTPSLTAYDGKLGLAYQQLQAFNVRLFNDGGTIKHRIGVSGDSSIATNLDNKINNATTTLTTTPTGANATTAFAAGAKIGNPATSTLVLDTAAQSYTNQIVCASISYNTSTTALNVWAQTTSDDVNGTTRQRLVLQFTNATTGATYDLTTLPSGAILEVNVLAFLA